MKWPDFSDPNIFYIVVCFVEAADLEHHRADLERLGSQRNIRLIVQPCPYEGIEFLYRIDGDLVSHRSGFDEQLFCKVLTLKRETPKASIDALSDHYYAYFCAVIDQNEEKVRQEAQALQGFKAHFIAESPKPS